MSGSRNKRVMSFYRLILPVLMILILGMGLNSPTPLAAQSPLSGREKIGPGVVETLRTDGEARVVIALVESEAITRRRVDLANLRREVAAAQDEVLSLLDVADFRTGHRYRAVPALSGTLLTEDGLNKLVQSPNVARIDLDVGGTGSLATSVPLIGADTWHDGGVTADGVVVAVLDSGMDTDHSDLAAALIHQACFLDNDGSIDGSGLCPNGSDRQLGAGSAEDDAGHGTHVTGIVASRGNQSSFGVAPGTDVVSIKVTAGPSFSGVFYFFSEVVAALDYIIDSRPDVQVINMSLVTSATFAGDCDNSTSWTMAGASAINTLRANGVIAFASSGNTSSGTNMAAPACLSNVISVGATDNADNVASFTSSNATTDIMAPGVDILSSNLSDGTTTASGTSMASPHAAGCAALLIASGEAVTPDQIETRLETSPVQVTDATNGLTFPRMECSLKALTDVAISGPITGTTSVAYPYTATTSPLTATRPITYVWEASGHSPVTRTGGLSDTLPLVWETPGTQTITVTALNFAGAVSDTHIITVSASPPTDVAISGPITGTTGVAYPFTVKTSPLTATQPITYVWEASGHSPVTRTGGLSDTLPLAWETPGTQTITVTALNFAGAVSDTHIITVSASPPTDVAISGPITGTTSVAYPFTVKTSPLTATQPVTYVWEVSGHAPVRRTGGLSDTLPLAWETPGIQTITVTALNTAGEVTGTHIITITESGSPPAGVAISGPTTGTTGVPYSFTATMSPLTAALPITYVWEASGHSPVTRMGGLSDTVPLMWNAPGTQVITVTALNIAGAVSDTHTITVDQRVFLPAILK